MRNKCIRMLSMLLIMVVLGTVVPTEMLTVNAASYANTYINTGKHRKDIIGVAKTQIGYREGSNNDTKYGDWYGLSNQPWCAMFVSWCARQAGIPKSILKNSAIAAPDAGYFDIPYYNGNSYVPEAGDLFFTKKWTHVGLVYYIDGDYFYTIEGNSNDSGSSEGIGVFSIRRKICDYYFGVPNYNDSLKESTKFSTPIKAYTLATGKTTVYSSIGGSAKVNKIYDTDRCTINKVYGEFASHDMTKKVDATYLKTEANCMAKAVYYKSCSFCGIASIDTFETGKIDSATHTGKTEVKDAVKETCTVDGYSGDVYCKDCGVKLEEGKAVQKGHKTNKVNAVSATHEQEGNIEYFVCSGCDKLFADEGATTELTLADTIIKKQEVNVDNKLDDEKTGSPKTFDSSMYIIWATLLLISISVFVSMKTYNKKVKRF